MPLRCVLFLCFSGCVGTADMVLGPQGTPPVQETQDAGSTPVDSGMSLVDAGATDAGSSPFDAGVVVVDAGVTLLCGALETRLIKASIDVAPASVDLGSSFGWSNNRPVLMVGLSDGSARVAWSSSGTVHVTPISPSLQRQGPDVTTTGVSVRGFVAHDDGTLAVLVVRGTGMFIVKLRADGSVIFETAIVNDPPSEIEGARWVDSWGHEGRLLFTGQVYVAYFGHTKHWGAMGKHQGDLLITPTT